MNEWIVWTWTGARPGLRYDDLPPDLTPCGRGTGGCPATWIVFACTRHEGHTGRHAAGDGSRVVAVWP